MVSQAWPVAIESCAARAPYSAASGAEAGGASLMAASCCTPPLLPGALESAASATAEARRVNARNVV
jgi:hypothetical protein